MASTSTANVNKNEPSAASNSAADSGTPPSTENVNKDIPLEPASSYSGKPLDVFLNFRGVDTRYGFTDHLYQNLVGAGVKAFRDDMYVRHGDKLGHELLRGINESKVSIPIFSERYAESKWCLRELAEMVECMKKGEQKILPIFYKVEPSQVKNYNLKPHKEEKDLEKWQNALGIAGELKQAPETVEGASAMAGELTAGVPEVLKGEIVTDNRYEGELVKSIVQRVKFVLKKNNMHLPELFGMDNHIKELEDRLMSHSNGAHVIGILGMSGLGKTTIAKDFYNKLNESFESHCFLEDVGGKSRHDSGLMSLQKQLVSEICNRESPIIKNVDEGADEIKQAIQNKKVFIVLDDVDDMLQIEKLAVNHEWNAYGGESLIIITTTKEEVLLASKVTSKYYRPELMGHSDALNLFCKHAFQGDSPSEGFYSLANKVVSKAGGLPLVLVVLGSLFSIEKDEASWEATSKKIMAIPLTTVLERLRIGYDALEYHQKQIFLDIACFFAGVHKEIPFYMWEDCGFIPSEGIKALVRRSLITIKEDDGILRMNDQLKKLGRHIVKEKVIEPYMKDPWKRSRLWDHGEGLETLGIHQGLGVKKVEALHLNLRAVKKDEYEQLLLVGEAYEQAKIVERFGRPENTRIDYIPRLVGQDFSHLLNLRFLRLGYVYLDGDFKHLFSKLRWLEWRCCEKFTPINLYLKNLVILNLSNSTISDEWMGWTSFKVAKKLKVLILSGCKCLRRGPDFSTFTTLEMLNLRSTNLEQINPSLGKLIALRALDLSYCFDITKLNCSTLKHLEILDLRWCKSLLEISGLKKSESLTNLNASYCERLTTLGDLSNLTKLKELEINNCSLLTEIQGLENLKSLERLNMMSCKAVVRLPEVSLRMLKKLFLSNCENLIVVGGFGGLVSLEHLDLRNCKSLARLPDLSNSRMLKKLILNDCVKLCEIEGLGGLEFLELLDMYGCRSIVRLPELSNSRRLKELILTFCTHLSEVGDLGGLESLEHLRMVNCVSVERLSKLSNPGKLKKLDLQGCKKLREIEGLSGLVSLESLSLSNCEALENTLDFSNLKNLKILGASGLKHWTEIRGLEKLKFLQVLDIWGCSSLEKLPDLSNLKSFERLNAKGCEKLTEIQGLEELKKRHCTILLDIRLS